MNHYYYYIMAGATIDESSKFFKVAVGASEQANRDFLYLIAKAQDCGHYFEIVSLHSREFISKIAHSLFGEDDPNALISLQIQPISARDLVRSFKNQCASPLNQSVIMNRHVLRKSCDLDYRVSSFFKNRR